MAVDRTRRVKDLNLPAASCNFTPCGPLTK
jgi:hypothetical protein